VNDQSLESRLTALELRIKEMEKTLTTFVRYQGADQQPSPTFESLVLEQTEVSRAMQTALSKVKQAEESVRENKYAEIQNKNRGQQLRL